MQVYTVDAVEQTLKSDWVGIEVQTDQSYRRHVDVDLVPSHNVQCTALVDRKREDSLMSSRTLFPSYISLSSCPKLMSRLALINDIGDDYYKADDVVAVRVRGSDRVKAAARYTVGTSMITGAPSKWGACIIFS